MNRPLRESPFACRMVSKAGCGRGQGSAMNSLRSALTVVLAGLTDSKMQAKGDTESRRCASDILTIELVQNAGLVKNNIANRNFSAPGVAGESTNDAWATAGAC